MSRMIVQYEEISRSNNNNNSSKDSNQSNHNHNKDDIINVTKAAARKSILIQIAKAKAANSFTRQRYRVATSMSIDVRRVLSQLRFIILDFRIKSIVLHNLFNVNIASIIGSPSNVTMEGIIESP